MRNNTRLKEEVKKLRAELGLKPDFDLVEPNDFEEDNDRPVKSARSIKTKGRSSIGPSRLSATS